MTATIRTFRAPDAAAALNAVKEALGPEAIILSTREVAHGLLRRTEVEVTAALSHDAAAGPAAGPAPHGPPPAGTRPPPVPVLSYARPPAPMPAAAAAAAAAQARHQPGAETGPLTGELGQLRSAVNQLRRQLSDASHAIKSPRGLRHPQSSSELERLLERGVEPQLAESMLHQADEECLSTQQPLSEALKGCVAQKLMPARAPWRTDRRRIIALVGPTGVGKTTTLAKIAAKALMESQLKVALVTVDTYRIGASEQISKYGQIMNVPTFVAKDRGELLMAVGKSPQAQLILIDTAGRSLSEAVAKQAELIRSIPGLEMHLVLSAATGAREMAAAAERYRALEPERLIITKLDEAAAPGGVLSAAARLRRPISCVADGQRVPEDLHSLTGTEMADWVLGTSGLESPFAATVGG